MIKPTVLFIVGPTATGKSKIAVEVARRLNGEIISADSMLVYKGMDIGTAKPSKAEQKKIPHHLIDLFLPSRNFSVFEYRKRALVKIREILRKKKLPIVTGGTGLYVRALLEGLEELPAADLKLRAQLSQRVKKEGLEVLYAELNKKDPQRAAQIKPTDERRIVRALEISHQMQSKPAASYAKKESLEELGFFPVVVGITKDRAVLYQNIEKRVDQMFRRGLLKEVKKLSKTRLSRTALQAVGYKELLASLEGDTSLDEAKNLIKKKSRHLAKRQWTWFKREKGIHWVSWEPGENASVMVRQIEQLIHPLYKK